ncbi:gliding motility-associated C-terminal domain-containing protein [Dyadobacter crusticola]|uniref:gliding motility-associated C-terminal domain-containing protein n=1 Tax=Dyadobacter crusticola TaxID=292407 RepID=UPI0004E18891|nr:T9SS C-terminal target domain-containing protein [Dyadobacter crusticola]
MRRVVPVFWLILTLFFGLTTFVEANHIVGGELQMLRKGNTNTYEIRLIQFWDSNNLVIPGQNTGGNRDETADIYFYSKGANQLVQILRVRLQSTTPIAYQNKACATSRSLNTSVGVYSGQITLDPRQYSDEEGYYLVWERCCRNDDINNIVAPGDNGMVFYLEFPPLQIANSAPAFVEPNGQYICANTPFSMNMSAIDADGDELRYSLTVPMRGFTSGNAPFGNAAPRSPYPLVTWESGISLTNAIPGPQPLRIDNAGKLSVTANRTGLYVFAIQCEEYRNGKRIGLVRRDFQLLVIDCNNDLPTPPVITMGSVPIQEIVFCPESPIELKTESSPDWSYQWQLNGLNIPGATGPNMMVKDSGNYTVVKSYTRICSRDTSSLVVKVRHADPIEAILSADAPLFCEGASTFMYANGGNLAADHVLSWKKENAVLTSTSATIEVSEPGIYSIDITNGIEGCHGRDTMTIAQEDLKVTLPGRKMMTKGSRTTLRPVVTPPQTNASYDWSPSDGMLSATSDETLIASPPADTTYTVTLTSAAGCTYQASTYIDVIDPMYIPTAFSPDGDGHNDTFEIMNARDQIVEVRIYNRWGEVIHSSKGYETPWNGKYKGGSAPSGSYPYVIKTVDQEVTGTVLLLK